MASATKGATKKAAPKPAVAKPVAQDVDKAVDDLLHESLVRAREQLRVRVMPALELAILRVPSGPIRNRLNQANVTLLKALEELGA